MISLLEIATSLKKLRVFDFDDTIAKSDALIHVTQADGKKTSLTPHQYISYRPQPGDKFDYSEFGEELKNPRAITEITKIIRAIINKGIGEQRKLVILTARGDEKPVEEFLEQIDIDPSVIEIVALGDPTPHLKADWIEDKIKEGFNDIQFFDDALPYIQEVAKLKSKYPDIKIRVHHVKYSGKY